jgi:hypothetical protein
MRGRRVFLLALALGGLLIWPTAAPADTILYNNDFPLNLMASASTPGGNGFIEHESADDFLLGSTARINSATFTGLVPTGATIQKVVVEIYRVFPNDSTFPPSGHVPTRNNSPSDRAFATRDSMAGELSFTTNLLSPSFTALNSVVNGINPLPGPPPVTTGGEGPKTGQEIQFSVTLNSPFILPADHYFFVPQVLLNNSSTPFLWLSGPRPLTVTPFAPDLQSWIRDANLDPDWLRIGTDIVGGTTPPMFNAAFSITGVNLPEPSSLVLLGIGGCAGLIVHARNWRRRKPDDAAHATGEP